VRTHVVAEAQRVVVAANQIKAKQVVVVVVVAAGHDTGVRAKLL
jgi:hypothetical protein